MFGLREFRKTVWFEAIRRVASLLWFLVGIFALAYVFGRGFTSIALRGL